jgi:hypothetical protein
MSWFFYFFFLLLLFRFSECTNKLFDFFQLISFLVYINSDLPSYLEIFLISLTIFQKNIFPSIGAKYNETTDEGSAYHRYFSHIILDQNPNERITDRLGYSSSYILNGSGLLYFSLLSQLIFYGVSYFRYF